MINHAFAALQLAAALRDDDVLYVADDEQEAETLAHMLATIVGNDRVLHLPSSDALPGDLAPASPGNVGRRLAVLRQIRKWRDTDARMTFACLISAEATARRYPPSGAFDAAPPCLTIGMAIDPDAFAQLVSDLGYTRDDRVDEPGEVALRGQMIDIFPADAGKPVRIEIREGSIAALRGYDPATQRTLDDRDTLEIGRASEAALENSVFISAHLKPAQIAFSPGATERRSRFLRLAADAARRESRSFIAEEEAMWQDALRDWTQLSLNEERAEPLPRFVEQRTPYLALQRFAAPLIPQRRFILTGTPRDLRYLRSRVAQRLDVELAELSGYEDLADVGKGEGGTLTMPAPTGFVTDSLILVAATDLLGSRAMRRDTEAASADLLGSLTEIRIGDVIIHEDHGVGVVEGLVGLSESEGGGEAIVLRYAGDARRFIPVDKADRLWRYGGDDEAVTLDKLDGSSWQRRRIEIDEAIAQTANSLAEIAEARSRIDAPVIDAASTGYERFVSGFPYSETADQARAIAAVQQDLSSGQPMDRLVVGDVGYGKTEVALRAAALAALAGYQVAFAAPTTVLIRQHFETLLRRFEVLGLRVAQLSRVTSAAEKKAVKAGIADGSIAVVIGTSALFAKDVHFANLGLVIIDEEQRFGAKDKVQLRRDGRTHLLTLSATPIPRSLQSALVGLQQISIIATPPARRQPIRTSLDQYDEQRICTALMREKGRGGQSFFVVPRIEEIEPVRAKIEKAVPELKIVVAHGKLPSSDIDRIMVDFANGEGDVLLATNIIEAGLDIPRANTMIIWNADRFGLAQLHQLRGRVGRGNRRGQVILLTGSEDAIKERTMKRLRTLATYDRLGAGFDISARDLDMRGAGDLLGDNQAGHMKLIGVDLYQKLLSSALLARRGTKVKQWSPELHLGPVGSFPAEWIPEPDIRLGLYIRLARISEPQALEAFEEELTDRFGALPEEAVLLLMMARIRLLAVNIGLSRIDAGPAAIALTPCSEFEVDIASAGLVRKGDRLILPEATETEDRIARLVQLLEAL